MFPAFNPPSWISGFRLCRAESTITPLCCWTPNMLGLPLKSRFYPFYNLSYKYFRFIGRHLGFPASLMLDRIHNNSIVLLDPENVGVAVEIAFLSILQSEL